MTLPISLKCTLGDSVAVSSGHLLLYPIIPTAPTMQIQTDYSKRDNRLKMKRRQSRVISNPHGLMLPTCLTDGSPNAFRFGLTSASLIPVPGWSLKLSSLPPVLQGSCSARLSWPVPANAAWKDIRRAQRTPGYSLQPTRKLTPLTFV